MSYLNRETGSNGRNNTPKPPFKFQMKPKWEEERDEIAHAILTAIGRRPDNTDLAMDMKIRHLIGDVPARKCRNILAITLYLELKREQIEEWMRIELESTTRIAERLTDWLIQALCMPPPGCQQ